jgi:hypothetical protein
MRRRKSFVRNDFVVVHAGIIHFGEARFNHKRQASLR